MGYSSDLKSYNKAVKFSKIQAELTREIAEKYNLSPQDVITLQSEFGKFIHNRIENNFEVIFFAQFGKFIPMLQKKVGHKFEKDNSNGNIDNLDSGEQQEEKDQTLPDV